MLLKQDVLRRIAMGEVTLAFRRWRRPTVKHGGTLLTSMGQLSIESVDPVDLDDITEAEALAAGYPKLDALRKDLVARSGGSIFRISFHLLGPDPRIALRAQAPKNEADYDALRSRLERMDGSSPSGPWTRAVLDLIARRPAERAADLAAEAGMERDVFKPRVRKLKGLGLTESLAVGYRLSARGEAFMRWEGS